MISRYKQLIRLGVCCLYRKVAYTETFLMQDLTCQGFNIQGRPRSHSSCIWYVSLRVAYSERALYEKQEEEKLIHKCGEH